jgi:hypothetical protein
MTSPGPLRLILALALVAVTVLPASAADTSKVKAGTRQVEEGAGKLRQGKVGAGVEETAKGIGTTVVEGAKFTGEKLRESGKAAESPAKSSWHSAKESAAAAGQSVKRFFARLFSN